MNEEITKNINLIFASNTYENFHFDQHTCSIRLQRCDNSKDVNIFEELDILTRDLVRYSIDFSVDTDGTIIIS
ncbi:MAG: hypothetical protein U9Q04_05995 [Campylobacterota bacterium]|nr:hypothetical protein [Campylobacterota bacterium]